MTNTITALTAPLAVPFRIGLIRIDTLDDAHNVDSDAIAEILTESESAEAKAHGFSANWTSHKGEDFGFHTSIGYTFNDRNNIQFTLDTFAADESVPNFDNDDEKATDAREAALYLASEAGQALLTAYLAGFYTEFDGNNTVGRMTQSGSKAATALRDGLSALNGVKAFTIWEAEDWLQNGGLDLTAQTTDEEISALSDTLVAEAKRDRVAICGFDTRRYLEGLRDAIKAEAE